MTLPDYTIVEEIQRTSTTGVYRALDRRTGQPCVLKVLHTDYPTARDVGRLRHEYDISSSLSLDGVVRSYALEHNAHGLALVLEDFGGVPLSRVLASAADADVLTFENRLQIAIQLANTLGEIHRQGVIHRDIKPANILLNPTTGQVKIADFGIAVLADTPSDPLDQVNQVEGSLAYIAPEQTGRMNRATDYRADLYSLGVTLYEMLTSQLPFDSADPLELVHAHIARQPPMLTELNPDVPAPLAAVVLKLLAKTLESRYQSAAGLKADLEFCLEHWQHNRRIPNFPLAQHDSGPFQLPDGLYGRADEQAMQHGAVDAPMNYQHTHELIAAEQARLQGRVVEAMEHYDRAIEGAREHGSMDEAALANELAGMFYLVLGREKIARLYLSEARTCYAHWGAWAKVAQLEKRYPSLVGNSSAAGRRSNGQGRGTRTTGGTGDERLDVSTVVKAAQALSSEIELDTLLDKIVRIVIENAGAQRGVLVLERDGSLMIAAEEAVEQDALRSTLPRTLNDDAGKTLPSAVINYAWHTDESLVLSNPIDDQRFTNDPYIAHCQPQSILCIPIQSRGARAGIIYLENNLAADAFSRDRIEMARMLVAHAAISLENARLYESMKQEAQERTRAEEALRSITEATATVTGGDFFRSLVCYLASMLEVRYAIVAECTDAMHTRVRTLARLGDGQFGDNIEYDVVGTPCASVVAGSVSYYSERLSELFPHSGGMESYLGAPLHDSSGGILGHLAVMHDQPMHRTPYDISLLQIFAARAGVELERKRADEALKRREEELRRLNERLEDYNRNLEQKVLERTHEIERRRGVAEGLHDLLTILNSSRALDDILDYIVAQAIALLDAQSSAIYRLQQNESILSIQASRGLPLEYVNDLTFSIHSSFMGRAMVRRVPVVISNPGGDRWLDEIEISEARRQILAGYQTLLVVPLVRQGDIEEGHEIYGGIALYYRAAHEFSEEEIGLAVAFADQAALAIQNAQLRQRVKQAAVMEERSRLARDLHDSVTQSLYSLTLLAEGWRRLAGAGRLEDMTEPLTELGGIAQQALKEMRLLVHELRPPTLEREGLLGALHERLASVERRAGVEARLLADDVVEMPPPVEEELYRIAQEALNNALKHAAATAVTVHLRSNDGMIALEVVDNGVGFDPEEAANRGGIGLSSMRERAEKFGGALHIRSRPQQGTCVKIELRAN